MKSLGIDYTSEPYQWVVTVTPKGVIEKEQSDQPEEAILQELVNFTDEGSATIYDLAKQLKWPLNVTASAVKRLQAKKLVTFKFLHDMKSTWGNS